MDRPSPIQIILDAKSQRVTVELRLTGAVLAYCFIGDDDNIEQIADILAAKKLPEEAMALRQLAMDARKNIPLNKRKGVRLTGL